MGGGRSNARHPRTVQRLRQEILPWHIAMRRIRMVEEDVSMCRHLLSAPKRRWQIDYHSAQSAIAVITVTSQFDRNIIGTHI